jgi:hypothetical protein
MGRGLKSERVRSQDAWDEVLGEDPRKLEARKYVEHERRAKRLYKAGRIEEAQAEEKIALDLLKNALSVMRPKPVEVRAEIEVEQHVLTTFALEPILMKVAAGQALSAHERAFITATAQHVADGGLVNSIPLLDDGVGVPGSATGEPSWAELNPNGTDLSAGGHSLPGAEAPEAAVRPTHREDPAGSIDIDTSRAAIFAGGHQPANGVAHSPADSCASQDSRQHAADSIPPGDPDSGSYVPLVDDIQPPVARGTDDASAADQGASDRGYIAPTNRTPPHVGGEVMSAVEYWQGGGHARSVRRNQDLQDASSQGTGPDSADRQDTSEKR